MLVTMKELLDHASRENYAVPAPNIASEMDARPIIAAAEALRSPLILAVGYTANPDLTFFGSYLRRLAEASSVPIAIHLDHGKEFSQIMHAVQSGFTSVMYDCSMLAFEENVARVRDVVRICHSVGVTVEAELGHVGQGAQYDIDRDAALTQPEMAKEYVEATGVDCLAVAIGTAHGTYSGTPYLDFDRLTQIKRNLGADFPLVLHGGSGTGNEALHKVAGMGINKINIATDMYKTAVDAITDYDFKGNYYGVYKVVQAALKDKAAELIELFGSVNRV